MITRVCASLCLLTCLAGCGGGPVHFFEADAYPQRLSDWGIIKKQGNALVLGTDVLPYDLNTPLFTDYAQKLRTIYLPPGTSAKYDDEHAFEFPVGTVVSKTFFYPKAPDAQPAGTVAATMAWDGNVDNLDVSALQIIETRLLVRQPDGWDALPYVWRGTDAYLKIAGDLQPMRIAVGDQVKPFPYIVPTRNECASCHATNHSTGLLLPIGLKARHLNRRYAGGTGVGQLADWRDRGWLAGLPAADAIPRSATWRDEQGTLAHRARSYLDINCGHCHNPAGSADTSGLMLDIHTESLRNLGLCKPPIAAGRGSGGRRYSIIPGQPDASILVHRMEIDDPGNRMPEVGRSLAHSEGIALVRRWIADLPGSCVTR
ncbi:MAG: hypothetical protein OES38_23650 [Gammaproteobacteria bacterium]|nr:hypothetical protein [Gammaproteobacteria bacterium]